MRFSNLNKNFHKPSTLAILRWVLGLHEERVVKFPATGVAIPFVKNDGSFLQTNKDSITWIGHASFLIRLGGKNILIDPVYTSHVGWYKRNVPAGLDFDLLPQIDFVLITHNHRDHLDADVIKKLGGAPVYLVPDGLKRWFNAFGYPNVFEMSWWEEKLFDLIKISFVPAQHWSKRSLFDTNKSHWGGFVVQYDNHCIYHSGDTGWFNGFEKIAEKFPKINAALLPIGAYAPRWFMRNQHISPEEAVRAFQILKADNFIAMHWGTFKLSDEPLDEPPKKLQAAWKSAELSEKIMRIPAIGETIFFDDLNGG